MKNLKQKTAVASFLFLILTNVITFQVSADEALVGQVTVTPGGLFISLQLDGDYPSAVLRVANQDGRMVANEKTTNASVSWIPAADDVDGYYHYEIILVPKRDSSGNLWSNRSSVNTLPVRRINGSFELNGGVLTEIPQPSIQQPAAGLIPSRSSEFSSLLYALINIVIPVAHAADVVASDFGIPAFILDDLDNGVSADFWLQGNWNTGGILLVDVSSDDILMSFQSVGSSEWSIYGTTDGDLALVDGNVYIDKATGQVGIGTTAPLDDLHIMGSTPAIILDDFSSSGGVVFQGDKMGFGVDTDNDYFPDAGFSLQRKLRGDGAADAMILLGDGSPSAKLHISGTDSASIHGNTTKLYVQNTSFIKGSRVMAILENYGDPMLVFKNTQANESWQMNPIGKSFVFSRGGTGTQEARLTSTGNLVLRGVVMEGSDRNMKDNIQPVDTADILARIASLPIARWRYKADDSGASHMGPMAQDFYGSFGLGQDERKISSLDLAGTALAAIQALDAKVKIQETLLEAKDSEIAKLRLTLTKQESRLADMETAVSALTAMMEIPIDDAARVSFVGP